MISYKSSRTSIEQEFYRFLLLNINWDSCSFSYIFRCPHHIIIIAVYVENIMRYCQMLTALSQSMRLFWFSYLGLTRAAHLFNSQFGVHYINIHEKKMFYRWRQRRWRRRRGPMRCHFSLSSAPHTYIYKRIRLAHLPSCERWENKKKMFDASIFWC